MFFFRKQKKPTGTDKRKYFRAHARNLIKLRFTDSMETYRISNILDLSEGGLKLIVFKRPSKGVPLDVIINLPERNASIKTSAEIRWTRQVRGRKNMFYAGIEFKDLTASDRELLKLYISSKAK
jgi:hypothetical protein